MQNNWVSIISLLLSIVGWIAVYFQTKKWNKKNIDKIEEANRIAYDANSIAKNSIELSQVANRLSETSLYSGLVNSISSFDIGISSIKISNDAYLYDEINKVIKEGTIECKLNVSNTSTVIANHLSFEPNYDNNEMRSTGITIRANDNCIVELFGQLRVLEKCEPLYSFDNKREYKYPAELYWENGFLKCTCEVLLDIIIERINVEGTERFIVKSGNEGCSMRIPKIIVPELIK